MVTGRPFGDLFFRRIEDPHIVAILNIGNHVLCVIASRLSHQLPNGIVSRDRFGIGGAILGSHFVRTVKNPGGIFKKTDIEQPLTRGNLINLAHFLPEQPKDFDLHLVETFNEVVNLILHDQTNPVNTFEQLEYPT